MHSSRLSRLAVALLIIAATGMLLFSDAADDSGIVDGGSAAAEAKAASINMDHSSLPPSAEAHSPPSNQTVRSDGADKAANNESPSTEFPSPPSLVSGKSNDGSAANYPPTLITGKIFNSAHDSSEHGSQLDTALDQAVNRTHQLLMQGFLLSSKHHHAPIGHQTVSDQPPVLLSSKHAPQTPTLVSSKKMPQPPDQLSGKLGNLPPASILSIEQGADPSSILASRPSLTRAPDRKKVPQPSDPLPPVQV